MTLTMMWRTQGFEPGSYQLYACAIDTSGARSCATTAITVEPPAAATTEALQELVADEVAKIDVSQLASTGALHW
jgi:hypothetical protein